MVATIAGLRRRPKAPRVRFLDRVSQQNLVFTVLLVPGLGFLALIGALFLVPAQVAYTQATREAIAFDNSQLCDTGGGPGCRFDTQAAISAYEPTDGVSATRISFRVDSASGAQALVASFRKGEPAFTAVGERVRVEVWRRHVMWMTNPGGQTALSLDNPEYNKGQLFAGSAISAALVLLAGSNALVWLVVSLRLRRARNSAR